MSRRAKVWVFLLIFMLALPSVQFALVKVKKKKLPDLFAVNLSSDTVATVGAQLQHVVAEVRNQGKKPAGAFRIHYYLSLDNAITVDDLDTGATCESAGLSSGESISCSTSIDLPASLAPGTYYLGIIIDDQDSVAERDESNNAGTFGPLTINPKDVELPPATDTIRIDGDPRDWAGISPILNDDAGDGPFDSSGRYVAGSDILHIWVTNDNTNVYFLMEFAGAPFTGGLKLFFDTDVNPITGCNGMETLLFTSPTEPGAQLRLADYRDCSAATDYPGVVMSAVQEHDGHSFVEARIGIDDLFVLTPGRKNFRFTAITNLGATGDSIWPPTVYTLTAHYPGGADLGIAFDSPVVQPDFTRPCGSKTPGWHFGMTLTETGGVGLTIISYKTVLYDSNGGYLITLGANSSTDFARSFVACGPGSNYIAPNGQACSQSLCLDLGGRSGGQIDMTFDGIDDKGNEVRFTSGRLILSTR